MKQTIMIRRPYPNGEVVEAQGLVIAPGIAIVEVRTGEYSITHLRSGAGATPYSYDDAEEAARDFWHHLSHIDWTRPANELLVDADANAAIRAIAPGSKPSRWGTDAFPDIEAS